MAFAYAALSAGLGRAELADLGRLSDHCELEVVERPFELGVELGHTLLALTEAGDVKCEGLLLKYGPAVLRGDVVGVGVRDGRLFFTVNGDDLGAAFTIATDIDIAERRLLGTREALRPAAPRPPLAPLPDPAPADAEPDPAPADPEPDPAPADPEPAPVDPQTDLKRAFLGELASLLFPPLGRVVPLSWRARGSAVRLFFVREAEMVCWLAFAPMYASAVLAHVEGWDARLDVEFACAVYVVFVLVAVFERLSMRRLQREAAVGVARRSPLEVVAANWTLIAVGLSRFAGAVAAVAAAAVAVMAAYAARHRDDAYAQPWVVGSAGALCALLALSAWLPRWPAACRALARLARPPWPARVGCVALPLFVAQTLVLAAGVLHLSPTALAALAGVHLALLALAVGALALSLAHAVATGVEGARRGVDGGAGRVFCFPAEAPSVAARARLRRHSVAADELFGGEQPRLPAYDSSHRLRGDVLADQLLFAAERASGASSAGLLAAASVVGWAMPAVPLFWQVQRPLAAERALLEVWVFATTAVLVTQLAYRALMAVWRVRCRQLAHAQLTRLQPRLPLRLWTELRRYVVGFDPFVAHLSQVVLVMLLVMLALLLGALVVRAARGSEDHALFVVMLLGAGVGGAVTAALVAVGAAANREMLRHVAALRVARRRLLSAARGPLEGEDRALADLLEATAEEFVAQDAVNEGVTKLLSVRVDYSMLQSLGYFVFATGFSVVLSSMDSWWSGRRARVGPTCSRRGSRWCCRRWTRGGRAAARGTGWSSVDPVFEFGLTAGHI